MAEQEFEGDLTGSVFWGADLTGATFRDVNLTGVRVSHAWLVDVEIDALVDTVVINGVDVTAYVNERDPWYPLRAMIRPTDRNGFVAAIDGLEAAWAATLERAERLSESQRHESVDGQFSVVQTLRHLVFAQDKWFTLPLLGATTMDPIGLPNTGSLDFPWPGLDLDVSPSYDEVLAVRARQATQLRAFVDSVTPERLQEEVDVLENGTVPVSECLYTVFEEQFWHNRYAVRDLAHFG